MGSEPPSPAAAPDSNARALPGGGVNGPSESVPPANATEDLATIKKRMEDALRENEARFRVALATAPIVVFNQDLDLRYTWIGNPALGLKVEEGIGRTDAEILGPEAAAPLIELKRRVLQSGAGERREVQVSRAGQSGWFDSTIEPLHDTAGRIIGITGAAIDITQLKVAAATHAEIQERLQLVLDATNAGLWDWDPRTGVAYLSPKYYEITGYRPEEIAGEPEFEFFKRLMHPEDLQRSLQTITDHLEGRTEESVIEYRMITRDGSLKWIVGHGKVVERDAAGQAKRMVGLIRDISRRKRLEMERAAALERLAATEEHERQRFAHALHDQTAQRLVALAVELKCLETEFGPTHAQTLRVGSLRRAVDELQQQVREMAWDLRTTEPTQVGLHVALQEYCEEWAERVEVPLDIECRGFEQRRLPATLETVLYRIVREALTNVEKHAQAKKVSVLLEYDEAVARLTIEDDGIGFDADAELQLPDTGPRLGLLGMQERVTRAGGTLLIESTVGSGTTLLVRIPVPREGTST